MADDQVQEGDIDLLRYLEFIIRRRWIVLACWLVALLTAVAVTYTTRPVYQASSLLEIEKGRGASGLYENDLMVDLAGDYFQTQYRLFLSNAVISRAYNSLGLEKNDQFGEPGGVSKIRRALKISPVTGTRLVNVQAQAFDPVIAARIANGVSQAFITENLNNQLFISKDILQTLQASRAQEDSLPAVVRNPTIQAFKAEYVKLEAEWAEMSQQYTPKYPAMVALKSRMETLQKEIQLETSRVVQSLKTELSGQLQGNNVRIVDPAETPGAPVKPQPSKNLLMGAIGGLFAGLIVAFLVETIDQSIRTQQDVEDKLKLPFLASIPLVQMRQNESVCANLRAKDPSLTGESFRNLRTMVDFAGIDDKSRVLMLSSAVQEEGKSYVACNLALAFAQTGERVIFIDGDLRRPKVHRNLGLSGKSGLSDFLAKGQKADEIAELIQKTSDENLSVLACGPRPPNPSELLNTPRVAALLAWAKAHYDRVIVDCTPMFPINDTLLWGRHVRSAVFVARYGKTRTPLVRHACQKLLGGGVKILGVAVNAATPGGLSYSYYGQYYHQYYHSYTEEAAAGKA